jgi:hypothetical protein
MDLPPNNIDPSQVQGQSYRDAVNTYDREWPVVIVNGLQIAYDPPDILKSQKSRREYCQRLVAAFWQKEWKQIATSALIMYHSYY